MFKTSKKKELLHLHQIPDVQFKLKFDSSEKVSICMLRLKYKIIYPFKIHVLYVVTVT